MKLIIHSPKYGKHIVLYDDEDHRLISKYHLRIINKNPKHDTFYVNAALKKKNKWTTIQMQRLIMGFPNSKIDHKNRNGIDNRKSNLRLATNYQNGSNRVKSYSNTSGYKGVFLFKPTGRYMVQIVVKKKRIYLGYYSNASAAAKVYNQAAIKYHGEFARLNPIP